MPGSAPAGRNEVCEATADERRTALEDEASVVRSVECIECIVVVVEGQVKCDKLLR